ncbi:PleD family two-component system response regulator [Roseicella aquatilis]|uniref:diguanylate cyclase n=1 Tax=Roseicella aquatilis TaxID=2527868 RepID=A0A4R4DJD3_9PROT|nr:PleD family two-component system response regulator [Roseicella aquatilis]TCZ61386.1 PleD family two-component system response regulator [Roseicella aquatilis]
MTARILVVDDIPANLRLLEAKLSAEYYEVALASSGPEALAMAARWAPDVVLLDVMMPGMDGYEVCRRLKADEATAHIPVVMVTALIDQAERVRGLQAGADDFLSKPVDDATMFARLRALLRVKQVQDAWRQRTDTARILGIEPPPEPRADIVGAKALVLSALPGEAAGIAEALAAEGVSVRQTGRAEDARQILLASDFDLAVICLPPEGGDMLRLASRLRAEAATRDLPVLLAADPGQRGLVLRGFDLGANDHVLRPIDPNELRARARNQVRRKWYQERLRSDLDRSLELAVTDTLTGLRNRRYVLRHLDSVLRGSDAAVMLLDVDRFKTINDTYGHGAGDIALKAVAERLKSHLRAADVLARYGGEEFMVVLAGAAGDYAMSVAERLLLALGHEPIPIGPVQLQVTVSIGLALAPVGCSAAGAIAAADAALYRAKAAGRNRVECAVPEDFLATPPGSRPQG